MQIFSLALCIYIAVVALNFKEVSAKPTEKSNASESNETVNEVEVGDSKKELRAEYAKMMKTFMNQSIDPCEDFYEYACGNWKNVIKEHQAQHKRSNLLDIVYKLADAAGDLFAKEINDLNFTYLDEWNLTRSFYESCLSADLYPVKASNDYLEVINSIGGFPAINKTWTSDNFTWFNMSAYLSVYGISALINEDTSSQYPFPPYFKIPELGFDYFVHSDNIASNTSRGYILNEKRMREYLVLYGAEENKVTEVIAEIFEFWHAVLNVTDQFEEDFDKCELMSNINDSLKFPLWDDYFEIVWNGKKFNASVLTLPCDYFYNELDKICNERKEAVANYLALKFLFHFDARLKEKKFQQEYCIVNIMYTFPYLIDELYLQHYFNEEIKTEVTVLVKEIRKSLLEILESADWLDEITRSEALLKESTIIPRIGALEDTKMKNRLIREMKNIKLESNYEKNTIVLKKFKNFMKRYNGLHYEELDNSTKPLELLIAMQVNAFYYNVDNSINVMAGILHPPAYDNSWPNSLKFGTLGYLIGHEFTHGFDSTGANFDSKGEERYWWSKKSGKVFDDRTDCYVNQYNNYLIPEINRKVNGNQTKDENIADSGGLREALSAYRRYTKHSASELKDLLIEEQMPDLDLSPDQLFFLGFAQLWCAAYKEEHYWEELSNEHTMNKYRVLGAVTNLEEFSNAYNCPVGSKMNPSKEKCRLW